MRSRTRLAVGLGLVVALVLVSNSASALWVTSVTATSTVKVANLDDSCVNVTAVKNASFELPNIQSTYGSSIVQIPDTDVEGWVSTPEHVIEIWNQSNPYGLMPPVGNQFIELNASQAGTLSQSIATTPGQTLQWSLLHRGRGGVDTMDVLIGPSGGAQVSQGNISDGVAAWVRYSGAYVVPPGQLTTQISFRAVSTGSGSQSIGNFLDDVSFGSGPCLQTTSTATNLTTPGSPIRASDQVEYVTTVRNIGSSPSFQSVLTNTLPTTMSYVPGSMKSGTSLATAIARTDANDTNDTAKRVGSTTTAYLGTGATSSAGGSIAQGDEQVFRFLATPVAASVNGSIVAYTPTVTYVNALAPNWVRSITSPDAPITVYNSVDLAMTPGVAPVIGSAGTANAVWTLVATNNGRVAASAATVRVTLPANMAAATVTAPLTGGASTACSPLTGAIRDCVFGAIAPAATRTITVTMTTPAGQAIGTAFSATASVLTTTAADYNAANNAATITAAVTDTTAPTSPGAATFSATTATGTTLTWSASTDNVAVARYNVFRNGAFLASVAAPALTYTDSALTGLTVYNYSVQAEDAAGYDSVSSPITYVLSMPADGANYAVRNNNGNPGTCLSVANTLGAPLLTADCAPASATQQFRFVPTATGGFYTVASLNTANLRRIWSIVPQNNSVVDNFRKVVVENDAATAQSNWLPRLASDNVSVEFYNPNSNRCLDVNGAVTTTGVQLQLYDCNGTPAQRFIPSRTN